LPASPHRVLGGQVVVGLIGIVAGGLVTGASSLYLEWRRERGELRQAKRLAAEELHTIWAHLLLLAGRRHDCRRVRSELVEDFVDDLAIGS
jgi:hypothetical protein